MPNLPHLACEQEIQGYKMEAQKQSKLIYQLEKEREKYSIEASEAAAKCVAVFACNNVCMYGLAVACMGGSCGWGGGRPEHA